MSRYYTSMGERPRKEPVRPKRGRKKASVGQEAAQALEQDNTQKGRLIKDLRKELQAISGLTDVNRNSLVDEIQRSDMSIQNWNMTTLAAALYMRALVQEQLRAIGGRSQEELSVPAIHFVLAPDVAKELGIDLAELWKKATQRMYSRIVLEAGPNTAQRRDQIQIEDKEAILRYLIQLANHSKLDYLRRLLTQKYKPLDVERILLIARTSGAPIYEAPSEDLFTIMSDIDDIYNKKDSDEKLRTKIDKKLEQDGIDIALYQGVINPLVEWWVPAQD